MRVTRSGRATALGMSLLMLSAGIALADGVAVDGDTAKSSNNLQYQTSANSSHQACSARGTAVAGQVVVTYNGNRHFNVGATVTATVTPSAAATAAGITATGGSAVVPASYNSNGDTFTIAISTTVPASAPDGTYSIAVETSGAGTDFSGSGPGTPLNPYSFNDSYSVDIDCGTTTPSNSAPVVSTAFLTATVNCQNEATLRTSFTDTDSTSWTAAVDWDYDGSSFNGTSAGSVTSPFDLTHTYAAPGTYTAGVVVTDNQGAASNVATDSIDVLQTYSNSFLQPIENLQTTGEKNTFKNGRVIPVKVTITDDCSGDAVTGTSGEAVTVKLTKAAIAGTGADAVETYADAGQSSGNTDLFRWSADGFWIYNLDSKALGMASGSTYELKILVDGIAASMAAALQPTK